MDATWAVQSNFLNRDQVEQIANALNEYSIPFVEVVVIPFSDEFDNVVET